MTKVRYEKLALLSRSDAQIQNRAAGKVYIFGADDIAEEEINTDQSVDMDELRPRGKAMKSKASENTQEEFFIEKEVQEGESIHSVALKYGCTVAELKRVNNLIKDQDFFALTSIKIPAKRHGLLLELVENEKKTQHLASSHLLNGVDDYSENVCDVESGKPEPEIRKVSIRDTFSNQGRDAMDFLQKMDSDIRNIVTSTRNRLDSLEEVKKVLTCKRIFPLKKQKPNVGADCGIRWWSVVIVMFVIGLVTPLFYFVYFEFLKASS